MQPPPGYQLAEKTLVCRLRKSLYGLKQVHGLINGFISLLLIKWACILVWRFFILRFHIFFVIINGACPGFLHIISLKFMMILRLLIFHLRTLRISLFGSLRILALLPLWISFRKNAPQIFWHKLIWHQFIPPKISVLLWRLRLFHNKLPTEDNLQRRGFALASVCCLCDSPCSSETSSHLFFQCSFAQKIWQWLATQFHTTLPTGGVLNDLFQAIVFKGFRSQLHNIWITACFYCIHIIWKSRNKLLFDSISSNLQRALAACKATILYVCRFCSGHICSLHDLNIMRGLGINPLHRKAPRINQVLWHCPPFNWVKVNTDGLAKGNPGPAACAAIFRDYRGDFLGACAVSLGNMIFLLKLRVLL